MDFPVYGEQNELLVACLRCKLCLICSTLAVIYLLQFIPVTKAV